MSIDANKTFNSAQEVFEYVVSCLALQGKRCFVVNNNNEHCQYKNRKLRCAAGQLIPDSIYDPAMENMSWRELVESQQFPIFKDFLNKSGLKDFTNLIDRMQICLHDSCSPKTFQTKESFIDNVNRFVDDHNYLTHTHNYLTHINWTDIIFSNILE